MKKVRLPAPDRVLSLNGSFFSHDPVAFHFPSRARVKARHYLQCEDNDGALVNPAAATVGASPAELDLSRGEMTWMNCSQDQRECFMKARGYVCCDHSFPGRHHSMQADGQMKRSN